VIKARSETFVETNLRWRFLSAGISTDCSLPSMCRILPCNCRKGLCLTVIVAQLRLFGRIRHKRSGITTIIDTIATTNLYKNIGDYCTTVLPLNYDLIYPTSLQNCIQDLTSFSPKGKIPSDMVLDKHTASSHPSGGRPKAFPSFFCVAEID